MSNPKDAVGRSKPGLHTLPIGVLFDVGAVMQLGAEKYGPYNWRETEVSASVYYNAILRHLARWWEGQDFDDESSRHHLAHVVANCLLFMDAWKMDRVDDDRPARWNPVGF